MKANKTHISLETAKLLKDCRMESELYFAENEGFVVEKHKIDKSQDWKDGYFYPAYTWGEILWENAEKFFSKESTMKERNKKIGQPALFFDGPKYKYYTIILLELLQQKKYEEADLYFREHTILKK